MPFRLPALKNPDFMGFPRDPPLLFASEDFFENNQKMGRF
jgi:hypothetical protein